MDRVGNPAGRRLPPDWRSARDYDFVRDLEDECVAWEFLRRNPAYRADAACPGQHDAALARRWGLLKLHRC